MKVKMYLTDKYLFEIVARGMGDVIAHHPEGHPTSLAAIEMLNYFCTEKKRKKIIKKAWKQRAWNGYE